MPTKNHSAKILLIGKGKIGKTIFNYRLSKEYSEFKEKSKNDLGLCPPLFLSCWIKLTMNDKRIEYHILESSVQFRFHFNSDIFIIFYDSSDRNSFIRSQLLYNKNKLTKYDSIFVLLSSKYDANKKSVNSKNVVSDEEALDYADKNNIFFSIYRVMKNMKLE